MMSESDNGHEAYWQGKPVTANPCNLDTLTYREWKRGWYAAEAQEEADAFDFIYSESEEPWDERELDDLDWEPETNEADDAERETDDCDYEKDFSEEL